MFNDEKFMLTNDTAVQLYNEYADVKKVPIIDYHCHIPVSEIKEDKHFKNITEIWLGADHYKWRQMRVNGISEKLITGDGDDYEKFEAFASIMPRLIGNPLYHWSHMELANYFDVHEPLTLKTAKSIWDKCNEKITDPSFSARTMIKMSNVDVLCTTDDPVDTLEDHLAIAADESFNTRVLPAFRPDDALDIEKATWPEYMNKLAKATGVRVVDAQSLVEALKVSIEHFDKCGCKISDHGLYDVRYFPCTDDDADAIFKKAFFGCKPNGADKWKFKTWLLSILAAEYNKRGWVMQLHYGVTRNTNTNAFNELGINTGFDCLHNDTSALSLMRFLDSLESEDSLPKTILYSLNPNDNAAIDCIIGCFAGEGIRCKLQHGSAWWFNDHLDGMTNQLRSFAALSTLGNHVGMLTDSRSFLSYTRHDYFRRIVCNMIGEWVEKGMYPEDYEELGKIIKGISYENAKEYFGF